MKHSESHEKAQIFNAISIEYFDHYTNPSAISHYANLALEYALKHHQTEQEIYALANLGKGHLREGKRQLGLKYLNQSLGKAEKLGNRQTIIYTQHLLASYYSGNGLKDNAIELCQSAVSLCAQVPEKSFRAEFYFKLWKILGNISDDEKDFIYLEKALDLYRELGDVEHEMDLQIHEYSHQMYKGKLHWALNQFMNLISKADQHQLKHKIPEIQIQVGIVYFNLNEFNKAQIYFETALKEYEKVEEGFHTFYLNHIIGRCLLNLKQYEGALKRLNIAETIIGKLKGIRELHFADLYQNFGELYYLKKEFKHSESYFEKALAYAEKSGLYDVILLAKYDLGKIQITRNKFKEAETILLEAYRYYRKIESYNALLEIYEQLTRLYEKWRKPGKALYYHKMYFDAYKKVFNENKSKQMVELETKYESEKKERQIDILQRDKEISLRTTQLNKLKLEKAEYQRNAMIIGFGMILVILGLLFRKYLSLFSFWKGKNYIGQYKLMGRIGLGGMGTIYRAHHMRDKSRTLVLKVLRDEYSADENYKKRFKQEASLIDQISHPNIVKVLERGEQEGQLYIAMEHLQGVGLDKKLEKDGKLELNICYSIVSQITEALKHIHSKNIIHRDLKPGNIMLVRKNLQDNFVKLLDFGLAKSEMIESNLTRTGVIMGSFNYMSPEQLKGSSHTTCQSDIFSLGTIFYEMVTGIKAFGGEMEVAAIAIKEENPVPPIEYQPRLPDEMNDLILLMLSKDPSKRPDTDTILDLIRRKTI